jgi:hypothetical protein
VNAPAEHPDTVRIAYWAEYQSTRGNREYEDVSWAEWAAMSTTQRDALGENLAEALASMSGSSGWEVEGDEPEPAPELPAMPPAEMIAAGAKNARADHVNAILIGLDGWWVPDGEELAAARRQYAAEWDSRNPALAAVIAHVDAARDARREAHRRAKAEQRKAKHAANKEGRST